MNKPAAPAPDGNDGSSQPKSPADSNSDLDETNAAAADWYQLPVASDALRCTDSAVAK
jgi:hypothetical protein